MCRTLGIVIFLSGTVGLLLQQWYQLRQRSDFLQEMNQSLLRLHQAITRRNLPILAALRNECMEPDDRLAQYFAQVYRQLQQHEQRDVYRLFWEQMTEDIQKNTKEEERRLWVWALCSLFSVDSPGEDQGFVAYYEQFSEALQREYTTKKERQKVTACTTGMVLAMLLLLLL